MLLLSAAEKQCAGSPGIALGSSSLSARTSTPAAAAAAAAAARAAQ